MAKWLKIAPRLLQIAVLLIQAIKILLEALSENEPGS